MLQLLSLFSHVTELYIIQTNFSWQNSNVKKSTITIHHQARGGNGVETHFPLSDYVCLISSRFHSLSMGNKKIELKFNGININVGFGIESHLSTESPLGLSRPPIVLHKFDFS